MNQLKLFTVCLLFSGALSANPVSDLAQVGSATLKGYFWIIYNSSLYSPDGEYSGVNPNLALQIEYRRDISNEQLIKRTKQEWEKQNIGISESALWLKELSEFWPDVEKGDVIVLRVGADFASEFYLNTEFIGSIEDRNFTNEFLAIWLSESSSYPKLRNQLLGTK